ncbi:hypothetical protein [Sphingomonas rubra]|uniref:Uncharacterized protein n=1 Tax=Sphingomonas rubra TaxID=634430 RepID=A0A1I5RVH8_9SPHN|nr:hypothetical protein [Sphingomonas rubra]SFP62437.1 hypothetical protein SAMN04488241_104153 [Sphingomonas rubra]
MSANRVQLEDVTPAVAAAFGGNECLIWSGEHAAWWRHNCEGYTVDRRMAGRYTIATAYAATCHCGPEKGIAFVQLEAGDWRPAPFQARVQPWMLACFGEMIAGDREERNHRFLEEALELVQSTGCTASEAHQLVDYVFGRPVGEPAQEVGGTMVTLAALCLAHDLDMHAAAEMELARIWTKVEAIRAKQAAKPKHSPLPGSTAIGDVAAERARQIGVEGWSLEHDDEHRRDLALPRAAACYALANPQSGDSGPFWITHLRTPKQVWPYRWEWKPKDRRANLVRAAALLIAEIERVDREERTA